MIYFAGDRGSDGIKGEKGIEGPIGPAGVEGKVFHEHMYFDLTRTEYVIQSKKNVIKRTKFVEFWNVHMKNL